MSERTIPKTAEQIEQAQTEYANEMRDPRRRRLAMAATLAAALGIGAGVIGYRSGHENSEVPLAPETTAEEVVDQDPSEALSASEEPTTEISVDTLLNPPLQEYEIPSVAEATIDLTEIQSTEDIPEVMVAKMSQWIMTGATKDNYVKLMNDTSIGIDEFVEEIAHETRVNNEEAWTGVAEEDAETSFTAIMNDGFFDWMEAQHITSLKRAFGSFSNPYQPEITEPYWAEFVLEDVENIDNIDKPNPGSTTTLILSMKTNSENSVNHDKNYDEPGGGDGAMWQLDLNAWTVDNDGGVVYTLPSDKEGRVQFANLQTPMAVS